MPTWPSCKSTLIACRRHGLMSGLAGSLEPPDIPRLLLLTPDFLGFRGALCADRQRAARVDPHRVRMVRELIPQDGRVRGDGRVPDRPDDRLAAGRPYLEGAGREPAATDRIFVRDFMLPVRVGAYAYEQDKPQNVRFNVDITAARLGRPASDMRDVLSYDVIMDAIRIVVASGHIPLVETLAERIAAWPAGISAGDERDGSRRKAGGRAGRRRGRNHPRAPGRCRQGLPALSYRRGKDPLGRL